MTYPDVAQKKRIDDVAFTRLLAPLMIADPVRLRQVDLTRYNSTLLCLSSSLYFASRTQLLDTTSIPVTDSAFISHFNVRNLVHLEVYGRYFEKKFTPIKSSTYELERNSLLVFSLVIFPYSDICTDQAKSDDIVRTVSSGQSSFCMKFDPDYVVVTLSNLDCRARIPRQAKMQQAFKQRT